MAIDLAFKRFEDVLNFLQVLDKVMLPSVQGYDPSTQGYEYDPSTQGYVSPMTN